ncbi:MAG: threonine/serine dehydratase [Gemmatimonadaceae bacterium]
MTLPSIIPLDEIQAARERLDGLALRTPLVRLRDGGSGPEIWLKLENLQPIGSFKIRGAGNAMAVADPDLLLRGVWTASAGNMAQGVAWCARQMRIPCTVVVPDHAPAAKTDAVERLGGRIVRRPFDEWWEILVNHGAPGFEGLFVHPVSDASVIAGNGTIGLEIIEELEDVDAIVIPYGGGGLSCGIASAVRQLRPTCKIFAAEVETAAPLAPSLAVSRPLQIEYTPSFVDGIGGRSILAEMWPLASTLIDDSIVVSLREVADALRLVVERNHVVPEGAGATSVAAARTGRAGSGRIVAVVSGGNIDTGKLARILSGEMA